MFNFLKKKRPPAPPDKPAKKREISPEPDGVSYPAGTIKAAMLEHVAALEALPKQMRPVQADGTLDAACGDLSAATSIQLRDTSLSEEVASWFISKGFIGHQICALLLQNQMIMRVCEMPAKDALRQGYEIQVKADGDPDNDETNAQIIDRLQAHDLSSGLMDSLQEYITLGRGYGIRILYFDINGIDYEQPFDIDSVTPNSYRGIVQVDPYWCTPLLSESGLMRPESRNFYEPEYWRIGDKVIHRSHMVIYRTCAMPDILKHTYQFGGVPIPQRVVERIYAAERTANEAPMLVQSKRLVVFKTDMAEAVGGVGLIEKLRGFIHRRDNYGAFAIDKDAEDVEQHDTALADLDEVIMTQYQLVASAGGVPSTKLLGTTPKGFQSTGEYEESNYHEELETIQTHDVTPVLTRHYQIQMRSLIVPQMQLDTVPAIAISWMPLDSPTAKEYAEINYINAQTASLYYQVGALDEFEIREVLRTDKNSGYASIEKKEKPDPLKGILPNPFGSPSEERAEDETE